MHKVNIKGTAVANIEYTGIVKLSQCIKGKNFVLAEMHNAGGKPLFNFLANCLIGDFEVARLTRPAKIMLLQEDEETGGIMKASNTSFIYLLSKPDMVYSAENKSIVRYSFIIPQDFFSGTSFNAIGLYNSSATEADLEDYSAFVGNINLSNVNVSISSVLVLDWELHISN